MKLRLAAAFAILFALPAWAEPPAVAADILPVHSLVTQVMRGIGAPALIVEPGASPHGYALRPSQARALEQADIVFRVSDGLTPWLSDTLATLSGDARQVELMQAEGTTVLERRSGDSFEPHVHDGEDHGAHDHDPHGWLDPQNAIVWLDAIAAELAALDPENAATYDANAAEGKAALDALTQDITADLAPLRDLRFVVFHDAFQYFENRFGLTAAGAIALSDASDPGPARIAALRDRIAALDVTCIFSEPQLNPALIDTARGTRDMLVALLDPLGASLQPGATLYPQLLRDMATALRSCAP